MSSGAHDDLSAGDHASAVELLIAAVAGRHRDIPRGRGLVACERCDVAGVGGRVTLLGDPHAVPGRLFALTSRALTALPRELMRPRIAAGGEVTIAGGLVAI